MTGRIFRLGKRNLILAGEGEIFIAQSRSSPHFHCRHSITLIKRDELFKAHAFSHRRKLNVKTCLALAARMKRRKKERKLVRKANEGKRNVARERDTRGT